MANAPPTPASTPTPTPSATSTSISKPAPTTTTTHRNPPTKPLEVLDRERFILPRLPPADEPRRRPIRNFVFTRFYKLVLLTIYLIYSVYAKLRWTYRTVLNRGFSILYYHHRTPQLIQQDVQELRQAGKLPRHVSVIVEFEKGGLDTLVDEVAEITCWCASAGIRCLSVYEQTGVLKSYISTTHRSISQRLHSYFGKSRPTLRVHSPPSGAFTTTDQSDEEEGGPRVDIEVVIISEEDGRESLVDLTKTLCDMAQRGKIAAEDVSIDLIDAEVKENVIPEPNLLILFSPNVTLRGYPPWQIRLTEIFHVPDNEAVGYQVFLRALHKYAKKEMRFGR
ncbi:uncharacterized protein LAJ45_06805 [Morchella importuna]|uniref:ditrans,polycis-polyprenyl diphosphate synthase [(2E,6E)-farnesyldiphosphate specific] n=1 Tax=Morchella conica CCBAS932 TaxID=1392247 RepID=A0A3N4KJA4_9PEZI|nr:uncharacterized protein LAJ45_06805 [Morchella importuna]KAH8149265.1 hypothetical protein LAJ45_06805 [Morchella importuna]RPB09392.1 Undecaprenyl diphosphate synthase [Morchella conica CCBAS932]